MKILKLIFCFCLLSLICHPLFAEESGIAHFQKAFEYQKAGRNAEAIVEYKNGLVLEPDSVKALYNLAYIYYQANRYSEASQRFQRVVELDPSSKDATMALAVCYASLEKYDQALKYADQAKKLGHPQANVLITRLEPWRPQAFDLKYSSKTTPQKLPTVKISGPRAALGENVLISDTLDNIKVMTHNSKDIRSVEAQFIGFAKDHATIIKKWAVTWDDGTKTSFDVRTVPSPRGGTEIMLNEIK